MIIEKTKAANIRISINLIFNVKTHDMKNIINLAAVLFWALFINACTNEPKEQKEELNIPPVKAGSFYETDLNSNNAVVIADTVTYDVVIKNIYPDDEWEVSKLKNIDRAALANIVFNAIYNGKLTAYDYRTEAPMSIKEVKQLEKEYGREKIGKMQFVEEWYFNEQEMQMGKRVNEIMLAYELNGNDGEVRGYKAGVKVYLTDKSKNK